MTSKSKIFGFAAIASGLAYLYYATKEKSTPSQISGLDINVDSKKLIDGLVDKIDIKGNAKNVVKNVANNMAGYAIDRIIK